jgi:hypothetical protein
MASRGCFPRSGLIWSIGEPGHHFFGEHLQGVPDFLIVDAAVVDEKYQVLHAALPQGADSAGHLVRRAKEGDVFEGGVIIKAYIPGEPPPVGAEFLGQQVNIVIGRRPNLVARL